MMFGELVESALGGIFGWTASDAKEVRNIAYERYLMEPYARGWQDWYDPWSADRCPAMRHHKVWIWRREWEAPKAVEPRQLHPAMNVEGLLWKPWSPSPDKDETRLLTA